jgi:hypothetical protein
MPHLGVLSTVYRDAAWNIFDKDCLIRLGTTIAPSGTAKIGSDILKCEIEMPNRDVIKENLKFGDIKIIELHEKEYAKVMLEPVRGFDVGNGSGNKIESEVMGGVVGILLDGRGRPIYLPENNDERKKNLLSWFKKLQLYPEEFLNNLGDE